MQTYLIRNDELVDKDTMNVVGYIDYEACALDIDYIEIHHDYPDTLKEIIRDYPEFTVVKSYDYYRY